MTNYNDGNWHGWNGGECPVHPQSVVTIKWSCNGVEATERAKRFDSWHGGEICAFRVVKAHRAPREWWIVGDCEAYASEAEAIEAAATLFGDAKPVHVQEVKE